MKMEVFSVFDAAAGVYGRPIFVAAKGVAIRSFADESNRAAPDNPMHAHPGDFSLWHLGSFDDNSGQMIPLSLPVRVVTALEVSTKGE